METQSLVEEGSGRKISHYRILKQLGAGGMAEVYLAEDLTLRRAVALKVFRHDPALQPEGWEALLKEAQRAAALNHPHIATVYDCGQEGDLTFISMEHVEGKTLAQEMATAPLTIPTLLRIALQIVQALRAAHARGIIHCDLKSGNVMVTPEGEVKLLDFGLSRHTRTRPDQDPSPGEDEQGGTGTPSGGTVGYMSPEQARSKPVDVRSDIFSCGVLLYEMTSGRKPFAGQNAAAVLHALLNDSPLPLGLFRDDVPLELEGIVRRCLEKAREERYASMEELLRDLTRLNRQLEQGSGRWERTPGEERQSLEPGGLQGIPFGSAWLQQWIPYRYWFLAAGMALLIVSGLNAFFWRKGTAGPSSGIVLLLSSLLGFLSFLYLSHRARIRPKFQSLPPGAAFRGLLPFQEMDRDRFYGREIEAQALIEKIIHNEFRFGVLFGDSGCGKTSLLRASLIPRLWAGGFAPIFCRSYKDPIVAILEECYKRTQCRPGESEEPLQYLERVAAELNSCLVVVCDQFEEFFVNHKTHQERQPFVSFVTACYEAKTLPFKILFSLRSDFLYLINLEFGGRLPEPLMSSRLYHLRNFNVEQAAEIIEKSARNANLPLEGALCRMVAQDLAVGDWVLPSELQIVGEQLQNKRIFSSAEYRRFGGKEFFVHSYLGDVLLATGDQVTSGLILRTLISEEGSRLVLTLDEIARRAQRNRFSVEQLLTFFVGARLVREIREDDPWRYELIHDYLIDRVNRATGKAMDATQRANRLFRQYLSNYSLDERTRIPLGKLFFIRRHTDIEQGDQERALLGKSLRSGAVKSASLALILALGVAIGAAALSINEEWEGVRLSDGHSAAVRQAVFSPDGRLLVSVGEDNKVIVWDFAGRQRLTTFSDHTAWVVSAAFSPDGKWMATGGADRMVMIYDVAHLNRAAVLSAHTGSVIGLAFSNDNQWMASLSIAPTGGQAILWEVGSWRKITELPCGAYSYGNMWFSRDNRRLHFSSGYEIDFVTAEHKEKGDRHPGYRMSQAVEREVPVPILRAEFKKKEANEFWAGNWAAVSPDGKTGLTVDTQGTVIFWKLPRPGEPSIRKLAVNLRVHNDHGRTAAFSPDGRWAVTGAENLILWDARSRTRVVKFEHSAVVWSAAFSPDSRWVVSTHGDGSILLWSVTDKVCEANLNEHNGPVRAVAFSPDGNRIASGSEDSSVILWDARSRQKLAVFSGHSTRVNGLAFSPDGRWLASNDQQGTILLWNLEEKKLAKKIFHEGHREDFSPSYCLAVSPDARWVSNTVGVFDVAGGHLLADLAVLNQDRLWGSIYGEDVTADGKTLFSVTDKGCLIAWNTETWQPVDHFEAENLPIVGVSLSPDDRFLATVDDAGRARLWSTRPMRPLAILGGHRARAKAVAFSPDGREVATAGDDQSIILWNVRQKRSMTRIGTHNAPVLSIAFSPDGRRLAAGGHDKSVRIYTRHHTLWGYRLD